VGRAASVPEQVDVSHRPQCFNVTDRHVAKSLEFVKRSRLSECSFCAGTAESNEGKQQSYAHEIRGQHD